MCKAALLSQNRGIGSETETPKSARSRTIQASSLEVYAIDLYLASAEDVNTAVCFFVFQEINAVPKRMQLPLTERRVKGQDAQSESQYAVSSKDWLAGYQSP